jgi:hypothetical protein
MATTMKAAILHGREDIRIERVPIPEALPLAPRSRAERT